MSERWVLECLAATFGVKGLRFRGSGLGFWGLQSTVEWLGVVEGSGFTVYGVGVDFEVRFWVLGAGVQSFRARVQRLEFEVEGRLGSGNSGFGLTFRDYG